MGERKPRVQIEKEEPAQVEETAEVSEPEPVDTTPESVDEQPDGETTPDTTVSAADPVEDVSVDVSPTAAQRTPAGRNLAQDAAPVSGSPTPNPL